MWSQRVLLHLLYALAVFQRGVSGVSGVIQTRPTVMSAVGGEARFSCGLMQLKEVVHVTWLKVVPEGKVTVATYTEKFGQRVDEDFRGKVEFEDAGLQNSSIVLRNVTEEDESCYHCLFNTHREGALTGTTCLQLYELHGPVVHVESKSAETAVSCSATGRPAPTVSLNVLRRHVHFSNSTSVSVTNTNATVTVNLTAVLPRFHDNSTQVECTVTILSVPLRTVVKEIPQSSADGFSDKSQSGSRLYVLTSIAVSLVCVLAAAVILVQFKQKYKNGDSMEPRTPRKKDTHEMKTLNDEHLRRRTPENNSVASTGSV